jgi:hypothetical protein
MKPQRRKTANLSDSVHHQLNSYALAAGAAGVGMLALAQPCQAKIVYTTAHITVPTNTLLPLDLNHDGVNDLSFTIGAAADSSFLFAYNLRTNGVVGEAQNYRFASALKPGAHIGAERKFLTGPKPDLLWGDYASTGRGGTLGKWKNAHDRYLGVKFSIKGKIHYGWVRVRVSRPSIVAGLITGYAYETIPNKPIIAGETKDTAIQSAQVSASGVSLATPTASAPQPASLGMLALGAQSLSVWRRKEYLAANA